MAIIEGTNSSYEEITGTAGDDTIDHKNGGALIDGGGGTDTIVYFANSEDFSMVDLSGILRIQPKGGSVNGDFGSFYSGVVELRNVEKAQFLDKTITLPPPSSNNIIKGRNSNYEEITGTAGDDAIDHKNGGALIDGGGGTDTIVYFANSEDFSMVDLSGILRIQPKGGSVNGDFGSFYSGTVELRNVEKVQFLDKTIELAGPTTGTWAIDPENTVVYETSGILNFTITRPDNRIGSEETVYISTTQVHGSTNQGDYTGLLNQPYTFGVGEKVSAPIPVTLLSDSINESEEKFGLIVQGDPTQPPSEYLASTTFTIQDGQVLVDLEKPSESELEYFARILAYDDRLATLDKWASIQVPFGYIIDEVFNQGTFQAVGLISESKAPILAIRGTGSAFDWLANFDINGVGYQEFIDAWNNKNLGLNNSKGIEAWLKENPDPSITGHSQAGAQAQLLAAEATSDGISLGKIVTFNSPGIAEQFVTKFNPAFVDSVKHWITSGDLVQLAGDDYIPGDIFRYNFDTILNYGNTEIPNYFSQVLTAHTNHWSNGVLYSNPDLAGVAPANDYRDFTGSLTFSGFSSPSFSYLYSGGKFDTDYFSFLLATSLLTSTAGIAAGVTWPPAAKLGPYVADALMDRQSAEDARTDIGVFLKILSEIHGFGVKIQGFLVAIKDTVVEAVKTASTWVKDVLINWTADTWEGIARFSAEIWQTTRELATEAWLAISEWSTSQWENVKDWTAGAWQKTLDFSTKIWTATKTGSKAFFDSIVNLGSQVLEATVAGIDAVTDAAGKVSAATVNTWNSLKDSSIGWNFLSKNKDATVVLPESNVNENASLLVSNSLKEADLTESLESKDQAAIFFGNGQGEIFHGGNNDDLFIGGTGRDTYNLWQAQEAILAQGSDIIAGTAEDLDGDTVYGFAEDDAIFVADAFFTLNNLEVTPGSAILNVDTDQDGVSNFTLTLKGEYDLDKFAVEPQETGTVIRYDVLQQPDDDNNDSPDPDANIVIAQRGVVSSAAGNDTYVLSSAVVDDNARITISDNQGANTVQLFEGLRIDNSIIASDTARFDLSNGAQITILGASSFHYETSGDPLAGTTGDIHDYPNFVVNILGSSVPPAGTTNSGDAITINADGTASAGTSGSTGGGTAGPNDDILIAQRGVVSKAAGDDTYVLSLSTVDDNAKITISDSQGANTVQLFEGLSIASSIVASDTALLTLTNGAEITVLSASSFTYETGGNPLAGTSGQTNGYTNFVAGILGTTVPNTGEAPANGGAVTIDAVASFNSVFSALSNQVVDDGAIELIPGAAGVVVSEIIL
ncbi:Lipase (class 3) [Nitrosomonas marina]|uniref:Lipase (Class 3) n=1 Tax=Nitrosomonas marina TaxID=917 RepID=A0A1I0CSP2_9PROT|nr:hypothetical protein [Nitrosomonas marina]SET22727.1 Lipase (class 3) [Nitrosomonas marina]